MEGERQLALSVDLAVDMFFEYSYVLDDLTSVERSFHSFAPFVREAFLSKSRFATRNGQICFGIAKRQTFSTFFARIFTYLTIFVAKLKTIFQISTSKYSSQYPNNLTNYKPNHVTSADNRQKA